MTPPLSPARLWTSIVAVAAAQTAVLGWMVWDRVSLLSSGREIVIDVVPVDPRDLFRGDYVRFGYDFSRLAADIVADHPARGRPMYVLLERTEGDKWKAVKASAAPISVSGENQVLLKGRTESWYAGGVESTPVPVRYGIESYFVPEGEGRDLESMVRDKRVSVLLAVGGDGTAAIKALLADGKPVAREKAL